MICFGVLACNGTTCKPPMEFKWGRKTCANESRLIRNMPGPGADPRATIRSTFRMNLEEIVALMGKDTCYILQHSNVKQNAHL